MLEQWRVVDDFPSYLVSTTGRIVRKNTHRELKPHRAGKKGPLSVSLSEEGRKETRLVHRIVAQAFLTGFGPRKRIRHLDGNLANNHILNLRFYRMGGVGQYKEGTTTVRSRYVLLETTGELFRTVKDAAEEIGGDPQAIYPVLRGERETYLGWKFKWHYADGAVLDG